MDGWINGWMIDPSIDKQIDTQIDTLIDTILNCFWKQLGPFAVRALNKAFEDGELSTTQKEGLITCI